MTGRTFEQYRAETMNNLANKIKGNVDALLQRVLARDDPDVIGQKSEDIKKAIDMLIGMGA